MKSKVALVWLTILFLFSGAMLLWMIFKGDLFQQTASSSRMEPGSISTPDDELPENTERLTEFTLIERSGKEFHSRELMGDVWVGSFFFTSCPQTCLRKNLKIQELDRRFGPLGVRQVSITCDPERDTPYVLSEYANRLNADPYRWLFLTGKMDYIKRVGRDFFHQTVDPAVHMEYLAVFDRQGTMRGQFNWSKPGKLAELEKMLTELLAETATTDSKEPASKTESAEQSSTEETAEGNS